MPTPIRHPKPESNGVYSMTPCLSDADRQEALAQLPGWSYDPVTKSIAKDFKFSNFQKAWTFMTALALYSESVEHHPDWSNSYNQVALSLSTHSEKGVTQKDIAFATKAEKWALACV